MNSKSIGRIALIIIITLLLFTGTTHLVQAAEPTTSVHIVKYAPDGTTVVDERTVDYSWMEANLPIQGDGATHYYHQGPVFEGDKWDPEETTNLKDKGAVMGTDLRDLCELVGGMSPGDQVMLRAADGYYVTFDYANVYEPLDRQGPIVLCWYNGDAVKTGGGQGNGYPPSYYDAMQLVFMAETTNMEGKYVFGNWDMHDCLPEEAQHFYGELYPSTNGLSVKWIDEIRIYGGNIPLDITQENESTSNIMAGALAGGCCVNRRPTAGCNCCLYVSEGDEQVKTEAATRFDKLISTVVITLMCLALALTACARSGGENIEWNVTLVGDEEIVLYYDEIKAMPSYEGYGGFFTTVGVVNGPFEARGVLLEDICGLVGVLHLQTLSGCLHQMAIRWY